MTAPAEPLAAEAEHPNAPQIRRQVEYYFSDENLPTDLHMLQCCGGRENLPVSIGRICGFKKMRGFKPKSIVPAALRKSAFLVVSDDGKQVSRKVPLRGPCALDPDYYKDDEIAYDPRARVLAVQPVPLLQQKKAELPPGMTKGMMKPTGFEETYVEPPITPAEAKAEEAMYDPDKHFVERIEIAIQRFKEKRKMHEVYSNIFNKWMRFGGVESAPRMFGGLSQKDMAGMDAEEIARARAVHQVPWDREDPKQWVVDFTGVGEAFLSSFFPAHYGFNPQQIKTACQVLRSFYNYLIYHSVCPEYREDLDGARKLCDTAEKELSKVYNAGLSLPGAFNTAASTIFGGSKSGTYTGNMEWATKVREDGVDLGEVGVMDEEARITFRTAVAIMGTDEHQALLDTRAVNVSKDELFGLEVVAINYSDQLTRKMYARQNGFMAPKLYLESLGTLICRSFHVDDFNEYDLPKDKYPTGRLPETEDGNQYEFWVEDHALEECFVGMKVDARVLTLEDGITILDDVREAMCSFYKWLPNELWINRHPKEVVIRKKDLDEEDVKEGGEGGEERFVEDESVHGG
ncbi:argonaute siRNA chaperone complex subunit Arb1 [Paraphaeosphaeria sporulosa]